MNTFELRGHERDQFQDPKRTKIKEETKGAAARSKHRRHQPMQKTKNTNKTIEEAKESDEESEQFSSISSEEEKGAEDGQEQNS